MSPKVTVSLLASLGLSVAACGGPPAEDPASTASGTSAASTPAPGDNLPPEGDLSSAEQALVYAPACIHRLPWKVNILGGFVSLDNYCGVPKRVRVYYSMGNTACFLLPTGARNYTVTMWGYYRYTLPC